MLVRLRLVPSVKDSCSRGHDFTDARACTCAWCDDPAMRPALQLTAIPVDDV